jgi:uncharacterized protein (TIGR03083 family)
VALEAEGERLSRAALTVDEDDFDRPTRCEPWSVRDLLAHVLEASNRLPAMLAGPPPPRADVSASGYYRPDERFSESANAARVAAAGDDAAGFATGHDLVLALDAAWREMLSLARVEAPSRVVATRWGDAMLLTDFLATRVVELAVHGLDLAAALDTEPWLSPEAAAVVLDVVGGSGGAGAPPRGAPDPVAFIEVATGRRDALPPFGGPPSGGLASGALAFG